MNNVDKSAPHRVAPYDRAFYDNLRRTAVPSATRIVPFILELCPANSVVDVGCADGSWLSVFAANGVTDILGFDGNWIAADQLCIPLDRFRRAKIPEEIHTERRFDLCVSLEVAEHLPASGAARFIAQLCALAPLIVFSAAIPHQGGHHHANEQWPDYWISLFAEQGFRAIDAIRPRFWDDQAVTWWYKQNMMLFASGEALARWPRLEMERQRLPFAPPAIVHPELFAKSMKAAQPGFGRWLRMGKSAMARSLRRGHR